MVVLRTLGRASSRLVSLNSRQFDLVNVFSLHLTNHQSPPPLLGMPRTIAASPWTAEQQRLIEEFCFVKAEHVVKFVGILKLWLDSRQYFYLQRVWFYKSLWLVTLNSHIQLANLQWSRECNKWGSTHIDQCWDWGPVVWSLTWHLSIVRLPIFHLVLFVKPS